MTTQIKSLTRDLYFIINFELVTLTFYLKYNFKLKCLWSVAQKLYEKYKSQVSNTLDSRFVTSHHVIQFFNLVLQFGFVTWELWISNKEILAS